MIRFTDIMKKIAIIAVMLAMLASCAEKPKIEEVIGFRGTTLYYTSSTIGGILCITNLSEDVVRDDVDFRIELSMQERRSIWGCKDFEDYVDAYSPFYPGERIKVSFEEELMSWMKDDELYGIPFKFIISYKINGGEWETIGEVKSPLPERPSRNLDNEPWMPVHMDDIIGISRVEIK